MTPNSGSVNTSVLPQIPQLQGLQHQPLKYANAYSPSGFDMLGVLVGLFPSTFAVS